MSKSVRSATLVTLTSFLATVSLEGGTAYSESGASDWATYNGSPAQTHYSGLRQINRSNVQQLAIAWRFDTGEAGDLVTNPLVISGILYGTTPTQKVVAIDAATGSLIWKFSPELQRLDTSRGVAYWALGRDRRIFVGVRHYLYALDARTGVPVDDFGTHGRVDLREGLDRVPIEAQSIALSTPGIVYKDLIIVGGREPETSPAPPGDVRAFDVRTGLVRWTFHTIPHPGEPGYETWPPDAWRTSGSADNWAGMALDERRGIVFVPTGPATDYYGADRIGDNLYANCLLALDATTGKRLWHFQTVRHDLWDRDLASPPTLLTVRRDGVKIDAVAQVTKQGFVFIFNRLTGDPLFPIVEKTMLSSDVPGEVTARTQPFPTKPRPFARQELREEMLTNRTPSAHDFALQQFRTFRTGKGPYLPLAVEKPTVVFPGFDGGAEWGGAAVDPDTTVLYVNSNDVPWTGSLAKGAAVARNASELYQSHCASCHGDDRKGSPPTIPSLIDVGSRLNRYDIVDVILSGRGRMPSSSSIPESALASLVSFLRTGESTTQDSFMAGGSEESTYLFTGYKKFIDPDGYPAVAPPWGTLNAINMSTGKYVWRVPLGEYPELVAQGLSSTGSENYGGPIVTAGGLLFIGATLYDQKFRAFDSATGKLLWSTTLPFSGVATPATYMVDGRQYIVIATSSARNPKSPPGTAYVAFALPLHKSSD